MRKMKNDEKSKPEELVIFLGAGASMPFGIPGMKDFIESLNNAIKLDEISVKDDEKVLWKQLLAIADQEEVEIDLEWILSILNDLSKNNLLPTIRLLYPSLNEDKLEQLRSNAKELKTKIEGYIKEKCQPQTEDKDKAIEFYNSFFGELLDARGFHPKIFTTNYDNLIESSNEKRNPSLDSDTESPRPKIVLVNGFSSSNKSRYRTWNPVIFEDKIIEDCIPQYFFKLHGSIDWYISSSGIIEIPAIAQTMKLTSGEEAGSLLIYPVEEKRLFSLPFTELFYQFRSALFYQARFLLIIGYSFRDEIFCNLLKEALERNKDLRIFIANTDKNQIIKSQNKFGEKRVIPITEAFGSGDFIPSLFNKLWGKNKTIIYQAEHLPKNGSAKIIEDLEAKNGIAVELPYNGAIYGPYRPLPEKGKYKITYRVKRLYPDFGLEFELASRDLKIESSANTYSPIKIARIDISPSPDIRKNYKDKSYIEHFITIGNFIKEDVTMNYTDTYLDYSYLDIPFEFEYDGEPLMEYRIENIGGDDTIRVDRVLIEKID
jgi:hypothetical protein